MKKGQVTIFIIIGVIILIFGLIFFFLTQSSVDIPTIDQVENTFVPVQEFILSCNEQVTIEAIKKVGASGGYIDPNAYGIKGTGNPTQSKGILIAQDYTVPYWFFLASDNRCTDCEVNGQQFPDENFIQNEIKIYVEENIGNCIDNFTSFPQFQITAQDPTIEISYTETQVISYLNYPITVSLDATTQQIENFPVEVDVKLKEIYDLSAKITIEQINNQFIEDIVMGTISIGSGVDPNLLPPTVGFQEGSSPVTWIKALVEFSIADMLTSYIPLIKVNGTKDSEIPLTDDPITNQLFKLFIVDANSSSNQLASLSTRFFPVNQPFYFDITPSNGELLEPRRVTTAFPTDMLPNMQSNHYEFFYDLSFPVLVEIRDDEAFNGEGYSFFFALEANVRDNKDILSWNLGEGTIGEWDYDQVEFDDSNNPQRVVGFDNETNTTITEDVDIPQVSFFCDEQQRISETQYFEVFDSQTLERLDNVGVTFRCGNYDACELGLTQDGNLASKLPICINGIATFSLDNYASNAKVIHKAEGEEFHRIYLDPAVQVKATMKIIPMERIERLSNEQLATTRIIQFLHDQSRPFPENYTALLSLERVTEPYEQSFGQFITFENNEEVEFFLYPGEYTMQTTLINQNGIFIPAQNETVEGQTIEYPEVDMTPAFIGGATLDATTGPFVFSEGSEIIFYVYEAVTPTSVQELENLGAFETRARRLRYITQPRVR